MNEISPWEITLSPAYERDLHEIWFTLKRLLARAIQERDEAAKRRIVEDLEYLAVLSELTRGLVSRSVHPDTVLTAYTVDGVSDRRIKQLHQGRWRAFFHVSAPPPRGEALALGDVVPRVEDLVKMVTY